MKTLQLRCFFLALALCTLTATLAIAVEVEKAAIPEIAPLDIEEITLANGLRIFVVERTASPTFAAIYQFGVGGAMDPKGRSGIAHLLEHMMFKGTTSVGTLEPGREAAIIERLDQLWDELHVELDRREDPFRQADEEKIARLQAEIEKLAGEQKNLIVKNEYDELMTRAGGVAINASTGNDSTQYFLQLPANRLEFWFRMESDRLLNPVFREFYSERDVVTSERRQSVENSPFGRVSEALDSSLFTAHPYGTPIVGWPKDVMRLRRQDAMDYFTTYYSPSNCVMAIVGDVTTTEVKRLAEKYFSPWKQQQLPRLQVTDEPPQEGERRTIVTFDAQPQLSMAWMTVPEGHPDMYPLDVVSDILGGLSSSRIDRTIVQNERIASRVGTYHAPMRFGGYMMASGTLNQGHEPAELERAIEREIQRIVEGGVTEEELVRSKITVEAARVRRLKSNLGQAFRIVNAVTLSGGTDYMYDYDRRIEAVTAEQVREVTRKYLVPTRKNVVELVTAAGVGSSTARGSGFKHERGETYRERGIAHSTGFEQAMALIEAGQPIHLKVPEIGKDVQRVELESGITVFLKEDPSAPSVEMSLVWLGGANTTPIEDLAAFELADQMLTEGGTAELDPFQLEERKDELGMQVSISLSDTQSSADFWSLTRNFAEAFGLAMDMLMEPRLDAERLATVKTQYVDMMRRRYDNPWWGGMIVLNHVFDHDHPRLGYQASRAEIEALTADDIRALWRRYLGRDNLYVTVVGDFEAADMLRTIEERLGGWRTAEDSERVYITREPVVRPGVYVVEKELPNPSVNFGHMIKVDRNAPMEDHAALEVLNDILGGSGFRSRLMERLRSDEGLTYGVYSFVLHQGRPGEPGAIAVSYQTGKDTVAYSISSVLEEVHRIVEQDVTSAEVQEQIEAWRNRFIFRYTNDFYSVRRLMENELDDRSYDFDREELDAVQKVTVADVRRVARQYIKPDNLTVAIFGSLTEADRKALEEKLGLTVLPKDVVFSGGFDAPGETAEGGPGE